MGRLGKAIAHTLVVVLFIGNAALAQGPQDRAAKFMESVRHQPGLLLAFLQDLPKGGDLHVHLYGAIYAESMIDWAAESGLCVDRTTAQLMRATCDSCQRYKDKPGVRCAYQDHILYNQMVDAWSMRNWHAEQESGHDHFFGTFDKFAPAFDNHIGDAVAEVAARAAENHLQYVELMHTADGAGAGVIGGKIWRGVDFCELREEILSGGGGGVGGGGEKKFDAGGGEKKRPSPFGGP